MLPHASLYTYMQIYILCISLTQTDLKDFNLYIQSFPIKDLQIPLVFLRHIINYMDALKNSQSLRN